MPLPCRLTMATMPVRRIRLWQHRRAVRQSKGLDVVAY